MAECQSIVLSRKAEDLSGRRFGCLVAKFPVGVNKSGRVVWLCACDCGKEKTVNSSSLKWGLTRSCGHLRGFGDGRPPEVNCYHAMIGRCTRKSSKSYKNYGGRGISVCQRWLESFENFLADVGPRPSMKHTLERENNDGNYEPGNVRWATHKEQQRHRSNNTLITYRDKTCCIAEWAERAGIKPTRISDRLATRSAVSDLLDLAFIGRE